MLFGGGGVIVGGGLYTLDLYSEGLLGLKVTWVCHKLQHSESNQRLITTFNVQNFKIDQK